MTLIGNHILSMTRGEVTDLVHARRDIEDYRKSLGRCINFNVLKYGGVTRTPGTLTLTQSYSASRYSRLIPFVFNRAQSYALEFSHLAIRVFTEDGQVTGAGTITAPWGEDDLWDIQVESIGDVMYISCPGYAPRTLTRNSATNWTLAEYEAVNGPFKPLVETGMLSFTGEGGFATDDMTSNTTPTPGEAVDDAASTEAFKAFNRNYSTDFTVSNNGAGWLVFDFGTQKTIVGYALFGTERGDRARNVPVSWVLQGRTTTSGDWRVIDSRKQTSDWLPGETRLFDIQNKMSNSRQLRFRWLGGGDTDPALTVIGELMFLERPEDQAETDVNANVGDINDGNGFSADDVGRLIRVMGGDGYWRTLEISSYSTYEDVGVKVLSPAPLDPTVLGGGSQIFQMGAWGVTPGYPECVFKHKGRLGWAKTTEEPRTFWISRAGVFEDLGTSQPLTDEDAVTGTLDSGAIDFILWGASNNADLFLGTAGGIRVIGKRNPDNVFGPDNFEEIGATIIPASAIRPVFSGLMMMFVDGDGKKIYETGFSENEGGYIARELTVLAEHIFRSGIVELHYQQSPEPTLWAVLNNGNAAMCTYDRDQQIFGVSKLNPPGTDAKIESMCILPITGTEVPMFVVSRTVNGATTRRIERMAEMYRDDSYNQFNYPIYLMGASVYDSTSTSVITGLNYLEGETVGVYDITNAYDMGDAVVSGGQITVPGGGTVTNALVGLRYTSLLQTLPPPNQPEDGRDIAHDMVPIRATLDVFETYGLEVAGQGRSRHLLTTDSDAALDPTVKELVTGTVEAPIEDGWGPLKEIVVETDTAYPATIRAILVEFDRGG